MSTCCSANVVNGFCSECGEHCGVVKNNDSLCYRLNDVMSESLPLSYDGKIGISSERRYIDKNISFISYLFTNE